MRRDGRRSIIFREHEREHTRCSLFVRGVFGAEFAARVVIVNFPEELAADELEAAEVVLSVRVVDGIDGALEHIAKHGSLHTEAIVTEDYSRAQRFVREVDASAVVVNASTRFNDGGQLGLGAEIGISTTKLHAYGPMGLRELCTQKWVIYGEGQVRA